MEVGDLLGDRYRLVAQRGLGGSSVVWQAYDELLGRDVAVKLLAAELAGDAALVDRLQDEAQAAARLHHPHLVTVYDFAPAIRTPFVVMELVEGQPLSELLADGPLPWRDAIRLGAQVASALAAAHARGIVHRDVKPDNVMLTEGGAKLLDFGISAAIGQTDVGPDGELLCTPAYLAPERLDSGPVRPASDVYGMGLLLYKSLTGELPWRWEGMPDLLAAHRYADPAPLPDLPGLPPQVAELCLRCLAKRPADRPTSREAARLLAAAAGTATGPGHRPGRTLPVAQPVRTRHPVVGRQAAPTVAEYASTGRLVRRPRRLLAFAAAGVALAGLVVGVRTAASDPPAPGPAAGGAEPVACQVRYDLRQDSGGQFAAGITITNTGTSPVPAGRLQFAFPADQRVVWSSAGTWQQSGRSVAVEGGQPAAALPAGRSVVVGFEGSYRDGNPLPTAFDLNGSDCAHLLTAAAGEPEPDPAPAGAAGESQAAADGHRDRPTGPGGRGGPGGGHDRDDRDDRDDRGRGRGHGHGGGSRPGPA